MLTPMGTTGFCLCFILFIKINLVTGQFLPQEELLDIRTCTLNSVNLNCDNGNMIAFQSAHFYYHATCESTCCQYSSDHDTVGASQDDIVGIRRICSGEGSCILNIDGVRTFDSGGKPPSYAILSYFCIPKSRTASICSADKLSSGRSLLYLTNEGFPSVTTDHRSCSCSLEVYSCASGFNMYLVDADMYLDEVNCQQGIDIFDGKNASLLEIKCASYYKNEIDISTFNTNYIRFHFTDNSASIQEGIFFVGFGATEANVAFKLSCAAEPQTTCIDCGAPNGIPNGEITHSGTTSSGSQATVSCHNGYETDNATLICLETGQWTNSTCSPKDCGDLYTITNGTITAVVDGSTTFGAKANVACDPGYQVSGYCNRNTEFQCADGTCINKSNRCDSSPDCPDQLDELLCQDVISCPEGQKLCDVWCVNEQVTCEESETSVAETDAGTISCLVIAKWEKVKCSAKDCGTPTDIENGNITLNEGGETTYMSTADVTCDTGFTPSNPLISCQADGRWENGTCNIIDCGVPSVPNGTVTLTNQGDSTFGSTAEIECNEGFTSSVSSITCQTSGQWENASCDINDCGGLDTIANGTLQLKTEGKSTYGSMATVLCVSGFSPSVAEITCDSNGVWENATCMINNCRELDPIKNGTLQLTKEGKTTYGSTATITCETGFTPSTTEIICQANSEWENATCKINDCGELASIKNGTLQLTTEGKTTYSSTATVTCETGFTPTRASITCQANSQWEIVTCNIIDCGMPPTISNGNFTLDSLTTYLSTATVSCEAVYHATRESIICQEDGTWTTAFCVLTVLDCGDPNSIPNGKITLNNGNTSSGSQAKVSCSNGYETDNSTLICLETGQWTNTTCSSKDCGELYTIPNGNLTAVVDGSTTFGANANVACDPGYQVSGYCNRSTEFQCGDGTCIIRNNRCDSFPDCPDQLDELLCQNVISCHEGQKLCDVRCVNEQETCEDSETTVAGTEAGTISCLVIGKWEKVRCSAKDCGTPTDIENGIITLTEDGQTTYMSTADVTCDTGFTPSIALIFCQADGSWENGTCNIIDCGEPYAILHGTITTLVTGNTTFGAKAHVACDPEYQVKNGETSETETGAGMISCLVIGKWEKVQCSAKDTAKKETGDSSTLPVIILACSLTAVVSIALTLIVMFIVRKYKRAKPNTLTSPPEHVVYYNTGVRENLENSEGDNHPYAHLNETNASEATYSTLDVDVSTNQRTSVDCL